MRLFLRKKLGQSSPELLLAVVFSLFLHLIIGAAALLLHFGLRSKTVIPPSYQVKLVDLPREMTSAPPTMRQTAQPAPRKQEQPKPKAPERSKTARKAAPAPKREAMPELGAKKEKKVEKPVEQPAPAAEAAGGKQAAVAVASTTQEFQFPPYVAIVRDKIERNWNPPPGTKGAKVKMVFEILRSGRVGVASLAESSGNFYFDQAAMRAILASSPFPPLPEGFFKDSETFSVDLMERD